MKKIYMLFMASFFAQMTFAQTFFEEGFEGDLSAWTLIDADGDGRNWDIGGSTYSVNSGSQCAVSASWESGTALTPNNYMISPAIDITADSENVTAEWFAYGQDQSWANENYKVVVATAATREAVDDGVVIYEGVVGANGEYVKYSGSVQEFVGQTIHLAFVHYNVTDQFVLNIDDVRVLSVLPDDVAVEDITTNNYVLANENTSLSFEMQNVGGNTVDAVTATYTVDGGTAVEQTFTDLNLASGSSTELTFDQAYVATANANIEITVTAVNGETDSNTANNITAEDFIAVSSIPNRNVVIEEGTGTWCGWCPRGAVGLESVSEHDDAIAIAVHNGDPMNVPGYDSDLIELVDGGGYPFSGINRSYELDPSAENLELAYQFEKAQIVPMDLDMTSQYDEDTRELQLNLTANVYPLSMNGNFRMAVVLTEDGVTGTTNGYSQTNYYSGGDYGNMGGYESLPDPVPAADMEYNHVGRQLLGGFDGVEGSIPTSLTNEDTPSYEFSTTLNDDWDAAKMHAVGLIIDADTRQIINAISIPVAPNATNVRDLYQNDLARVYPNPSTGTTNIELSLTQTEDVSVEIFDAMGKRVAQRAYGALSGNVVLPFDGSNLNNGMYFIHIKLNDALITKRLSISK